MVKVISRQAAVTDASKAKPIGSGTLLAGVIITASPNNTGVIYIGGEDVNKLADGTGTGYPLSPGQSISYSSEVNMSDIYIFGDVVTDFVSYTGS